MGKIERQRRPSPWLAIPVVMVLTIVWTKADYPLDYWLHINNGNWMVEHGRLITHDTFSHTIDGQPVSSQSWLAQIWMYQLHRLGGYPLNQFIAGLAYASAVLTVMYLVGRRSANWTLAACAGCVTVGVMATNLGVRPQYLSVVLFSAQVILLVRARNAFAIALGCLGIVALWTNLHGAYPLGVALPGLLFVSAIAEKMLTGSETSVQRMRRFAMATGAAALGCFARPEPSDAISYVTNCGSRSLERGLVEWLPTSLSTEAGGGFFASAVMLVAVLAFSRRRCQTHEVFVLCAFFLLACSSQRMVIWWAIVLPIMIARPADQVWRNAQNRIRKIRNAGGSSDVDLKPESTIDRLVGAVVMASVLIFVCFSTPWTRTANACLPPAKRVSILHDEPYHLIRHLVQSQDVTSETKNTFAPLSWGSYLTWHSHGQLKTFLDTRIDFFPTDVWNAHRHIHSGGPKTLILLDEYAVDVVVCRRNQRELIGCLTASSQWTAIDEDEVGKVFVRR